jgi:hypothetical protein
MYGHTSHDLPQQQYAELVQSRTQERLAYRVAREGKQARRQSRRAARRQPVDVRLAAPAPSAG